MWVVRITGFKLYLWVLCTQIFTRTKFINNNLAFDDPLFSVVILGEVLSPRGQSYDTLLRTTTK